MKPYRRRRGELRRITSAGLRGGLRRRAPTGLPPPKHEYNSLFHLHTARRLAARRRGSVAALQYYQSSGKGTWNVAPVNATQPQRRQLRRPPLARTGGELRPFRAVTATAGLAMVKDKKVDVIARDYTINLHKALHGMYAAPTRNSSSSLGLRGSVCGRGGWARGAGEQRGAPLRAARGRTARPTAGLQGRSRRLTVPSSREKGGSGAAMFFKPG